MYEELSQGLIGQVGTLLQMMRSDIVYKRWRLGRGVCGLTFSRCSFLGLVHRGRWLLYGPVATMMSLVSWVLACILLLQNICLFYRRHGVFTSRNLDKSNFIVHVGDGMTHCWM